MSEDEFRDLALAQPGAEERAHMDHPDFRANGRIFATLLGDGTTGMVKVAPEEQAVLIGDYPKVFRQAAGAWGRQGCTLVHLPAATAPLVRAPMQMAYAAVLAKPKVTRRARTRG